MTPQLFVAGAKPSKAYKLARRVELVHHPLVRAALDTKSGTPALPDSFDLAAYQPEILDQGQTGSCTCNSSPHAIATALAAAAAIKGLTNPAPWTGSQLLLYAAVRSLERALGTPVGTALPDLQDTGAELADVMTVLAEYGLNPMGGPSPDGRNSDLWSLADLAGLPNPPAANVNAPASFLGLERAAAHLVVGPYGVTPSSANISDVLAAALATVGLPIVIAFYADTAFMQLQPGQVMGAPNPNDPNGGGHAIYLSGYQKQSDGSRAFIATNSWGKAWCNAGRALVSATTFVPNMWEAHPMDVSVHDEELKEAA